MVDDSPSSTTSQALRFLAFYLPQFHPIPENDVWWGRGFTEWSNVVRAEPLFEGHHQPQIPADLGFYDLRLPEARLAQAELARAHGIDGFVYHHYWFGGRRLLERPFNEVLRTGAPDLPFALCWANEPWTSRWNGRDSAFLVQQTYSAADDEDHIRFLIEAFADERYIRVNGRPLLLIYTMRALPEPLRTVDRFGAACDRAGVPRPWIVKCDTFLDDTDPAALGADASCDFPPHGAPALARVEARLEPVAHDIIDYDELATAMVRRPPVRWTRYPTVIPSWDNTARRGEGGATVVAGSDPSRYERWLVEASQRIRAEVDDGIVFINAWNEWAEGAHLEPDQRWGRGYLEATLRAKRLVVPGFEPPSATAPDRATEPADIGRLYTALADRYRDLEAEATTKFEAGQAALRSALEEREREIAQLRDEARRQRAWADHIHGQLLELESGPAARAREAELEAVAAERDRLQASIDRLMGTRLRRLKLWLTESGRARTALAAVRSVLRGHRPR